MLEVDDLAAMRGNAALFAHVTFRVPTGTVFTITGPNGSGKTTLLRVVAGLTTPTSGTVRLDGAPVAPGSLRVRERVAMAGHAAALNDELSVRHNLAAALAVAAIPATAAAIDAALVRVGLERRATLPARSLSQGQRRRVMLARLLLGAQPLWVLDEPATALDAEGLALLQSLLHEHVASGGSALLATHVPLHVAGAACDALALA